MKEIGSSWNKWDLHVHTPESIFHRYGNDEDVWEKYISDLESLPDDFKVIGINDYLFIDGYERLLNEQRTNERLKNLLLMPVLEFRIEKFAGVSFGKFKRINFHVIFSPELSVETIKSQFLNTLQQSYTLEANGSHWNQAITKQSVEELGKKIKESVPPEELSKYDSDLTEGFNNLNLNENDILESLRKDCFEGKYLIAVGKTEWDELKWTDSSIAQKKTILNKAHIIFTASENRERYNQARQKLKTQGVNDLLFDCSDAHSFSHKSDEKDRIGNCINWLKSDISFDGLKHVLIEKDSRLYVGEIPEIKTRTKSNRTKYIESIIINQVDGYDSSKYGEWFNNIEIPLNPELVAIIGNKGNCKSALADIIGLCGDYSGTHDDFSFLNRTKFGEKNGRISQNFTAKLKWLSGIESVKNLNDKPESSYTEKVKYLPQGYFESITNESIEDFNKEIENVVFTHLDNDEKLNKSNFKELIDYKNSVGKEEIQQIKSKLHTINESILKKEEKLNPTYEKNIEQNIKLKKDELEALIEPIEIDNPNDNPDHAKQNEITNEKLRSLDDKIKKQEEKIEKINNLKKELLIEINDLKTIKLRIENKEKEFIEFRNSLSSELSKYENINVDTLIKLATNLDNLTSLISNKNNEYESCKTALGESDSSEIKLLNDLLVEKEKIQKELGEADKLYQKYLLEKKEWEDNKNKIIGNSSALGTLEYYNNELDYLNNKLVNEIESERADRLVLTESIFNIKKSVLDTYKNIKRKIDSIIDENHEMLESYPIEIKTSFSISTSFQARFLSFISMNRTGTFYGKENAEIQFNKLVDNIKLETFEDVSELLNNFIHALFNDLKENDKKTNIENQVTDVVALYDYLYSLDFVDYIYELRQGSKKLDQLSPGEKGALLLIFYLLLDNNDIPLIIDQPEDNLDNHSVANILVPFIKKAKSKRQIILVTHNPNLAVVADAEQIIYTELDKHNNNKFSYKAGSIEDPIINECIVKVLEGAMPAFNKRKLKYYENS